VIGDPNAQKMHSITTLSSKESRDLYTTTIVHDSTPLSSEQEMPQSPFLSERRDKGFECLFYVSIFEGKKQCFVDQDLFFLRFSFDRTIQKLTEEHMPLPSLLPLTIVTMLDQVIANAEAPTTSATLYAM
jgi:hypothetical protein